MEKGIKIAQAQPNSFLDGLKVIRDQVAAPSGLAPADSPAEIVGNAVLFLLSLAGIIALGVFIWGAVLYITSLGDESRAASAKRVMMYSIVGLILVMISYVIIRFVRNIIGAG